MIRRSFALAGLIVLATVLSLATPRAGAQTAAAPSAEQLDIFRSMTPEQQQAILQQLGVGGTGGALGGAQTGSTARGGEQQPQTAREENAPPPAETEKEPLIPVLKEQDWVIIEIDFHLPPRPLSQTLQALYSTATPGMLPLQGLQGLQGGLNAATLQAAGATPGANPQMQQQQNPRQAEIDSLSEQEKRRLTDMMELIRSRNPYQLTREGALNLPGFRSIPLLGLTEDQATLRLQAEPTLRDVEIRLTRLPLKKIGPEGLKPFGYDLFERSPSTFAPVTNVPVPADYVIGPGDQLEVQLYGNQNRTLPLTVGRDGRINLPEIGPISVSGQLFNNVRSLIEARVARQMIGVSAAVSMRDTRSIRVFVLGEARHEGSYVISGLGTVTSALFAAGGVKPIGSLRNIQLKRDGQLIRTLDLYDMLIRGDTRDDTKLLPGDVIFVPPVGPTVSVDGEVRRPAIYEIKSESSVSDVIGLAGGLTPEADRSQATVTRIDQNQRRVVLRIEVGAAAGKGQMVQNGDLLRVARLRPTVDSGLVVQGHVFTQGAFAYRDGLRLSDVIHSVDELQPNADIHYLLIRRELPPDRRVAVISADLAAALAAPGSAADVPLMPRDRITVFDLSSGRDRIIQPLIDELRTQSNSANPTELVRVDGRVKVPGEYPLEPGMRLADLIRAGGGLADEAYGGGAELTRYQIVGGQARRTQLIDVNLVAAMQGDPASNVALQPYDQLSIKEVPEWNAQESVTVSGEVRFPGTYALRRGETLRSVISRAGGLTDYAFPEGSVFTREELKRREQEQMDLLATRMQRDLAVLALQATAANQTGGAAALSIGQSLFSQLRSAKAVGRLVIDLPRAMRSPPGSPSDVILRNGDRLIVPRFQQEVTVIGEVQNSTSHLFSPGLSRDDYIALSGGVTNRADRSKVYVVRANGSVVATSGSRWFQLGSKESIKPGDTIVVPLNAEHMPALPFWQAVTSIIYNVAIAAAAVHSF
jgi:polysaccharide biosynthesis/export protein